MKIFYHVIASEGDIRSCIKIDKPPVVYIFSKMYCCIHYVKILMFSHQKCDSKVIFI